MNDWQVVVLEELKAINRKIEKVNDKLDRDTKFIEGKIDKLEGDMYRELSPLKKHVTQVKFTTAIVAAIIPLSITIYKLFFTV